MPRRVHTPASDDSLKENVSAISATVKAEKMKTDTKSRSEKERKGKGRQRDEEQDDDGGDGDEREELQSEPDEHGDGEDDEDGEGSPKGRKRARVNTEGDSRPAKGEKPTSRVGRATALPRDSDGFIPGSIIRIQLENFVTYDWVEFRPGPYLNMILGPNGTGKSSIACAICLGLNWSPSVLGRASELCSFVKLGKDKGHIEIELKGLRGKPNLVIRRFLSSKSKSSTFWLNGKPATGREISERMRQLNVQVGNLCSFLPQDKVSEFAAMTPAELLKETQRAAGDKNLTTWHETLVESGKGLRKLQEAMEGERAQLKTMEDRNAGLERDVLRYKERMKIQHTIDLLELLLPVQMYREVRANYMVQKVLQRELFNKVKRLKAKNAPVHALKDKLEQDYKDFGQSRDAKKKATQAKFKDMNKKWSASENLEKGAEELQNKLQEVKRSEKDRKERIKKLQDIIEKTKHDIDNPPAVENPDDIERDRRALKDEMNDWEARRSELHERQRANAEAAGIQQSNIAAGLEELRRLDDANNRKLEAVGRWSRDTHDTVLWLRENQHKFKMEVFEPPMICLTVPDKRFTNAIEACFSGNQMLTFVAQCQEDYDTLNHCINDSRALGRQARVTTWFRPKDGFLNPPPMSDQEMNQLGFDGYAINYVDCPDGLLWFLKKDMNMHRTAIALDGKRVPTQQAMDMVARQGPNGMGGGASFITGSTLNVVARSRYGKRLPQNTTREFRPARNLVNTAVDPETRRKIDNRIVEARREQTMIEGQGAELAKEDSVLIQEDKEFIKRRAEIKERKDALVNAATRKARLAGRLKSSEEELKKKLAEPPVEVRAAKIKQQIIEMAKKRVKIAKEYTQLVRGAISDQVAATRVALEYFQVGANKAYLDDLCKQKDEKYSQALIEFQEVDKAFQEIKVRSRVVLNASREKIEDVSEELRTEYNAIENDRLQYEADLKAANENNTTPPSTDDIELRDTDQLTADLETQRANLEMNLNTNPGVIEQYEKRKKEIENLSKTLEEKEAKAAKIETSIRTARENWEPALQKLVDSIGQRFSAAFDRIGCAGEISIGKDEKYEDWTIDIKVKFRDNEKLQQLTAHRQSGGERSLTTILYLMSLTAEARAPFSLVDEINQGMDARAERAVHNSMVEVTCQPDSTQYFLITPKLLPDLEYHERMKILCVNNGEWLPEERGLGNMMNMIDTVVHRRNRAPSAE